MSRKGCKALTGRGRPCGAFLMGDNEYCTTHGGVYVPIDMTRYECGRTKRDGRPCRVRVREEGQGCSSHPDEAQNAQEREGPRVSFGE